MKKNIAIIILVTSMFFLPAVPALVLMGLLVRHTAMFLGKMAKKGHREYVKRTVITLLILSIVYAVFRIFGGRISGIFGLDIVVLLMVTSMIVRRFRPDDVKNEAAEETVALLQNVDVMKTAIIMAVVVVICDLMASVLANAPERIVPALAMTLAMWFMAVKGFEFVQAKGGNGCIRYACAVFVNTAVIATVYTVFRLCGGNITGFTSADTICLLVVVSLSCVMIDRNEKRWGKVEQSSAEV